MKVDRTGSYVNTVADRLRMLSHLSDATMRVLVARSPGIAPWPARRAVGRFIWEQAQSVQALRDRMNELPAKKKDAPWDLTVSELATVWANQEGDAALVAALAAVQRVVAGRCRTQRDATITPDAPTKDTLEDVIRRADAQAAWAEGWLDAHAATTPRNDPVGQGFRDQLTAILAAIPEGRDWSYTPEERQAADEAMGRFFAYKVTTDAARDPRWPKGGQPEPLYEQILEKNGITKDSEAARSIFELMQYPRELQAADTVVQTMHEVPGLPWDFYYDGARHQWDEVRHYEMGLERLEGLGVDLRTIPMPVANYVARAALPPSDRYALLTMFTEGTRFPGLKQKYDLLLNSVGDAESAALVNYDHGDEVTHVKFGEKWVPVIFKHVGENRPAEQVVEESLVKYQQLLKDALAAEGASPHVQNNPGSTY